MPHNRWWYGPGALPWSRGLCAVAALLGFSGPFLSLASLDDDAFSQGDSDFGDGYTWQAPPDDPHIRRILRSGRRLEAVSSVPLEVLKQDYFSSDRPKLDIAFTHPRTGEETRVYLAGTNGNANAPTWLYEGIQVDMSGAVEADSTQVTTLSNEMTSEEGMLVPGSYTRAPDQRQIFVAQTITAAGGQRRLGDDTGTAPAAVTALVLMVQPCNATFKAETTEAATHNAFFGTAAGTFHTILKDCGRDGITLQGEVDTVQCCPASSGLMQIYRAAAAVQETKPNWAANTYKILVLPETWIDAIGVGQLGGTITWIKETVFTRPAVYLHELGHNWRLHHAGVQGGNEYADMSSVMGYCCDSRCFNFLHTWQLGWAETFATLDASTITNQSQDFTMPELGVTVSSGLKIENTGSSTNYYISYRGEGGFDTYLQSQLNNQVYVHAWTGTSRRSMTQTWTVSTARLGEEALIYDKIKLAVVNASQANAIGVRIFYDDRVITTTTTTPVPFPKTASDWFADEQTSSNVTSYAMVGIGCNASFCGTMRTWHRTDVQVRTNLAAWLQNDAATDILMCPAGQVVSRLRCLGDSCSQLVLECAVPTNGRVLASAIPTISAWVPATLHASADGYCPEGQLLTGLNCGSSNCGKKQLLCQVFEPGPCASTCSLLGIECGDDGCGGGCGSCPSGLTCESSVGRCLVQNVISQWTVSGDPMDDTNLVAYGMGCKNRYCNMVRLLLHGMKVDGTTLHSSPWISDATGQWWVFNQDGGEVKVADCPTGKVATKVECSGPYCSNVRMYCGRPLDWYVDPSGDPQMTDWFSEENGGESTCPAGYAVAGVECKEREFWCFTGCNHHCHNKKLRCRRIFPSKLGATNAGVLQASEVADMKGIAFNGPVQCSGHFNCLLAHAARSIGVVGGVRRACGRLWSHQLLALLVGLLAAARADENGR